MLLLLLLHLYQQHVLSSEASERSICRRTYIFKPYPFGVCECFQYFRKKQTLKILNLYKFSDFKFFCDPKYTFLQQKYWFKGGLTSTLKQNFA